ncbi:MAG: hypothetical protein LBP59_04805 [Planctomycetaceae bacterium]|jgi:hypothetical protein|nr:hypothetical protein [Planctomycetaceae bacterium]
MASNAIRAGAAFVELFADDSKLVKSLRSTSAKIKKWATSAQKSLQAFGKNLMSYGTKGFAVTGTLLGGLFGASKSFADEGDKFEKMAYRTGMASDALSELGYAAQLCGSDIETVEASVHKMQTLLAEAAKGSQGAKDKLAALGLAYADLEKLSPEEQFTLLIKKLADIKNDGQRAALTMQIFGESATKLLPMIDAGAESIDAMRAEARKLGISMSSENAKAAANFTDALTRLYSLLKGITNHIGAALAPELTRLVNWFVAGSSSVIKWIDANKELIVSMMKWSAIGAAVAAGVVVIGGAVFGLGAVIGTLGTIVGGVFAVIATAVTALGTVLGFLLTPIGLITAAIVGIGGYFMYEFGIISDGVAWIQECFNNLFRTATKAWQGIQDALAAGRIDLVFKVSWTAIKLIWTQGVNFLYEKWLWIQNQILTAWDATVYGLSSLLVRGWAGLESFWVNSIYVLQTTWTNFVKIIQDTWSFCMTGFLNAWDWAYTQIAKGLAWIFAKLTGMDATEMVRIVEEDHVTRNNQRNAQWEAGQNTRNENYNAEMQAIEQRYQTAHDTINDNYEEMLSALNDQYDAKQAGRQAAYNQELSEMEAERLAAEKEFNDAINEAANVRTQFDADKEAETKRVAQKAQKAQQETVAIAKKETKMSATGTFNAAAIQSLQSQGPMDKIAKNTEETAKYVKKSYEKKNIALAAGD